MAKLDELFEKHRNLQTRLPLRAVSPKPMAATYWTRRKPMLWLNRSLQGIRVNAIAPGFFSTAQNAQLLWNQDGTPTARTGKILAATPMGRFGESKELAGAVLFLLNNEAASFITGVTIPIDGGFSSYSGV